MEGFGAPRAAQEKETFEPTLTISSFGKLVNIGLAGKNKRKQEAKGIRKDGGRGNEKCVRKDSHR